MQFHRISYVASNMSENKVQFEITNLRATILRIDFIKQSTVSRVGRIIDQLLR